MLRIITSQQALAELGRQYRTKLLPVTRGIYIENPSIIENGCNEKRQAELINEALSHNKEWIAKSKVPSLVFARESAIKQGFVNGVLYGVGSKKQSLNLIDHLLAGLSPAVNKLIDRHKIEVLKSRSAIAGVGVEDVDIGDHTFQTTIPERTLIDTLSYYYDNKELAIDAQEILKFASKLGITFDDRFNESLVLFMNKMKSLSGDKHSIGVTQLSVGKAFEVLSSLKNQLPKVSTSVNAHTQTTAPVIDLTPAQEASLDTSLYFYNTEIAKFGRTQEHGWQFDAKNTWFSPMLTHNNDTGYLPALLKNIMREAERQSPADEAEGLEYGAFLGNLTSLPAGIEPSKDIDVLDVSLANMQANGQYYGELKDFPKYTDNMYQSIFAFIKKKNLPAISGCQIKIPAFLSVGKDNFQLAPSEMSDPFTHIVKIAPVGRFETVSTLEWFGMTLIKAAHVEVPPFALVNYSDTKNKNTKQTNEFLLDASSSSDGDYFTEEDLEIGSGLDFGGSLFDTSIDIEANDIPPAIMIERFDIGSKVSNKKLIGIEMTTVLGRAPKDKYNGTMEEVAQSLKSLCANWEVDSVELFRHLVANYLVCNGDYHLKNMSILVEFQEDNLLDASIRLSPAYDVVCTPGLGDGSGVSAHLCITVNGSNTPTQRELLDFAVNYCELHEVKAKGMISDIAQAIIDKMADIIVDIPSHIKHQPTQIDAIKMGHDRIFHRISDLGVAIKKDYYALMVSKKDKGLTHG
jgi:hypothetical protein